MLKRFSVLIVALFLMSAPLIAQDEPTALAPSTFQGFDFPSHPLINTAETFVGLYDETLNGEVLSTVAVYTHPNLPGGYVMLIVSTGASYGKVRIYSVKDAVMLIYRANSEDVLDWFIWKDFKTAEDTLQFKLASGYSGSSFWLLYLPHAESAN